MDETPRTAVLVILAGLLAVPPLAAGGQTAIPSFEVASVKVVTPQRGRSFPVRSGSAEPGGRWVAQNARFIDLLRSAYPGFRLPTLIVGTSAWMTTTRFDINAKASGEPSAEARQAMVRNLLAERFALKVHTEARDVDVYTLVVDRADRRLGPRMRQANTDCEAARRPASGADGRPVCTARVSDTADVTMHLRAGAVPMTTLIAMIQGSVRSPILDRTGLGGRYDIDLDWLADGSLRAGGVPDGGVEQDIFAALRSQLGLRLEPRKERLEVLVVDQAALPEPD